MGVLSFRARLFSRSHSLIRGAANERSSREICVYIALTIFAVEDFTQSLARPLARQRVYEIRRDFGQIRDAVLIL
jgi:hypothetical protein